MLTSFAPDRRASFLSRSLLGIMVLYVCTGSSFAAPPTPPSPKSEDQSIMWSLLNEGGSPSATSATPPTWYPLFEQAYAASHTGKRAEAERLFRKLLTIQPKLPEAWANIGILEAQNGKTDAALADFNKAISFTTNPQQKVAYQMQLVQLSVREHEWQRCADLSRQIIAHTTPDSVQNSFGNTFLGIALVNLKKYDEAVSIFRKRPLLAGEQPKAADLRLMYGLEHADKLDEAFAVAAQLTGKYAKDADVQIAVGDFAVRIHHFDLALFSYKAAYALRPTDARIGQNVVAAAIRLGDRNTAIATLRQLIEQSPNDAQLRFELGSVYFTDPANTPTQFETAEIQLRRATSLDPTKADYITQLALCIILQKKPERFEEARKLFSAALLDDPHEDGARLGLGYLSEQQIAFDKGNAAVHLKEAIDQYDMIIAENRHDDAEAKARRRKAGALITEGKTAEGYKEFDALIARFPDTYGLTALGELASLQFSAGDYPEAKATYVRLTSRAPRDVSARIGLGQVDEHLKDNAGAQASYEQALVIDPGNTTATLALGNLFRSLHRPKDAIAVYEKSIQAKPDNNQVRLQLGNDYEEADRIDDAVKQYQGLTIVKEDKNRILYLLMAPKVLLSHKRAAEAEKMLSDLHRDYPKEEQIDYSLAIAQEQTGKPTLATNTLLAVLDNYKTKPEESLPTRMELALLYERTKRLDEAASTFEDILRIDSGSAAALMGISRVRSAQQHPEAAGQFMESLALGASTPNEVTVNAVEHIYMTMDRAPEKYTAFLARLSDKFPDDHPTQSRRLKDLLGPAGIKVTKNLDDAEKLLTQLLKKSPTDSEWLYRMGTIREQQGRTADAIAEYSSAVKSNYGYGPAIAALKHLNAPVPTAPTTPAKAVTDVAPSIPKSGPGSPPPVVVK